MRRRIEAVRRARAPGRVVRAVAGLPVPRRPGRGPSGYAELLTDAGCTVDAWETTYVHELTGENPVLEWITGTALTPVKSRLDEAQWQRFRAELIPMLDAAYPVRPDGTTFFPFRRIFVVAQVK